MLPGLCSLMTGTLGFRQLYPDHYILPSIEDLQIYYHRKDIMVRIWLATWVSFFVFTIIVHPEMPTGTLIGAVTVPTAFIKDLPLSVG